jgi:hypothetical protein
VLVLLLHQCILLGAVRHLLGPDAQLPLIRRVLADFLQVRHEIVIEEKDGITGGDGLVAQRLLRGHAISHNLRQELAGAIKHRVTPIIEVML